MFYCSAITISISNKVGIIVLYESQTVAKSHASDSLDCKLHA